MFTLSNKKLTLSILTLIIVSFGLFILNQVNTTKAQNKHAAILQEAHTSDLTTYEYIVTEINSDGINGKSTTDNTGIYLNQENVKGLKLNESDKIKVTFPNDQWDVVTKVEKVN